MSYKFEYAVIQLADRDRDERLNAALAVFSEDRLDLRIPRRLEKLRALSAALDVESVRATILQLENFDRMLRKQGRSAATDRVEALSALSTLKFSTTSHFVAPSSAAYEEWIARLMRTLIEPEPAIAKPIRKRTKLISVMKLALRSKGVLAKRGEDLDTHRVVSNVQIAEGLAADFVLQNGAMHVIETVDASDDVLSPRKIVTEIAVSALVLEQARMTFGENATTSRLVYEASSSVERIAMPSLQAAAHQGTELVNWASLEDRGKLISDLTRLATPHERRYADTQVGLHASTQHRFKLN